MQYWCAMKQRLCSIGVLRNSDCAILVRYATQLCSVGVLCCTFVQYWHAMHQRLCSIGDAEIGRLTAQELGTTEQWAEEVWRNVS